MNEESNRHCASPDDCRVGDWITATSVPDWPIGERLHTHTPEALEPSGGAPTHPALAALFEQGSLKLSDDHETLIWIRKE